MGDAAPNLLIRTMEIAYRVSMSTQQSPAGTAWVGERQEGKEAMLTLSRLVAEDGGQDLAEYGIALAVISILAGLAAVVISKDVGTLWSQAQSVIQSATSSAQS